MDKALLERIVNLLNDQGFEANEQVFTAQRSERPLDEAYYRGFGDALRQARNLVAEFYRGERK